MRPFLAALFLLLPALATAQERASHFSDAAAFAAFVDDAVMHRRFAEMARRLGGEDEYTPEEMAKISAQLTERYPADFTHSAVIRETDLGAGVRQQARIYWTEPEGNYLYFYALLHDRSDGTVVLTFSADTDIDRIMALF